MFGSVVVFIGPPGVGKGTQAAKLSEAYAIPKFATGDLLREALKNGTQLGLQAKKFMDNGQLVPDELVLSLISEKIQEIPKSSGFILDGFPRTTAQAKSLDEILNKMCHNVGLALEFVMDEEDRISRLSGRRICPQCQRTYHVLFAPPKRDMVCDFDSTALIQRTDDDEKVIRQRSAVYWETTNPLLSYYKERGILRTVDASKPIDSVLADIRTLFDLMN
jgi:adenylate kinase